MEKTAILFPIPEGEISFEYIRAAGPGGQNVNKVSSAVQLYWNVQDSTAVSSEVKNRLIKLAGTRLTKDGILVLTARKYRTQEANKTDALKRLNDLIVKASIEPKERKKTKPTTTARAARVNEKKQRGEQKKMRSYHPEEWE